ncbi:MAG: hypothetical protein EBZ69_01175 [Alphaproteobacteria bacterium]|nr:hypothetical protein [Alphaproteobacteria bacterium]
MIKVIQPHSQDFSEPVAALIKVSNSGIIGQDKRDFVKRAGAEFAEKVQHIKFAKDEVPVHLVAIGATEDYGPNRNGDGFTRDCCRKYHGTFEKFARFYRDHANKNPAKSFGIVKASYYNEPMRRIELICALNGSKEAADRNGGLLADKEIEKLASGKDIPVSMACKIPFDKCSACGNKARTRAEYCDSIENGGHCKAGGLKHNLGRVQADGHVLHADNPDPTFFDISHVFRPADRIAYVSGQLQKAASDRCFSGVELAEQLEVSFPEYLVAESASKRAGEQYAALCKLAAAERELVNNSPGWAQMALASNQAVQPIGGLDGCLFAKMAEVFRGLADAGVILSLRDFLSLTVKSANDALVAAVSNALPNIFSTLVKEADIVDTLENNRFYPADYASEPVRVWAEKVACTRSLTTQNVEKRAYLAAIRNVKPTDFSMEKRAVNSAEIALAKHYALYKIAAFAVASEKYQNNLLTANHCVLQNYVS